MTVQLSAFPKIYALGTRYVQTIFDGPVEITEKIDGSQFTFGKIDGELQCRSKGTIQHIHSPDKMFNKACEYVLSIQDSIPDNMAFYCEYVSKPKHNVITYDNPPESTLVLFGVANARRDTFYPSQIGSWAVTLGISTIPVIWQGESSPEHVLSLMDRKSSFGDVNIEGLVVKAYKDHMLANEIHPIMVGKMVSEKFKEVHRKTWGGERTSKGTWDTFSDSYRNENRWMKAVQHLRENGELAGEPKDIGFLIKEVKEDIESECKDEIMEFLWKTYGQGLLRKSVSGLPEWYKEQLLLGNIPMDTEEDS